MSNQGTDGTREQLFQVGVMVDGVDYGIWDTWAGGDKSLNNTKYRSGGSPDEENLGGGTQFSTLTIGRNYRLSRDAAVVGPLLDAVDRCVSVIAVKTPLDRAYTAQTAGQVTVNGILTGVTDPKSDSNSANAATLIITIEPNSIKAT